MPVDDTCFLRRRRAKKVARGKSARNSSRIFKARKIDAICTGRFTSGYLLEAACAAERRLSNIFSVFN
jgi:hypothetical protein